VSLAVVGSIAFDSVSSPWGEAERQLGGSAVYASLAAGFFTDVRIVGPVGEDFGDEHYKTLEASGIDTGAIQLFPKGQTFFWRGRYEFDMGMAKTEETHLNVFEGWRPRLSNEAKASDVLFLAAMDPEVQLDVRGQWQGGKWAALDSMGYWIAHKRDALIEAIRSVDIVLMNDVEVRELTREPMLLRAAREVMSWGPRAVVLRFGEYGCALLTEDGYFSLPGFPLEESADPTGAGDAFAGAFLGYLDLVPGGKLTEEVLRRAVTYGSVMSSYCFEDFGPQRLARLTEHEVSYRFEDFRAMTHFEHVPTGQRPRNGGEDAGEKHLPHPGLTPSTTARPAPGRTPSTVDQPAPHRTPSTETLSPPRHPLGPNRATIRVRPGPSDDE
jgi:sugar/nucleoside kinase (ribokinase family)